jgi:hypothetical protein
MKAREEIEKRITSVNEQLALVRKLKVAEMEKVFSARDINLLVFLHHEKRVHTSALEALIWALHLLDKEAVVDFRMKNEKV